MFEKVSQFAEQAATNASRRRFLGRIGRGAMTAAAGAAGLLVASGAAHAGRRRRRRTVSMFPAGVCSTTSTVWDCRGKPVGSRCGHRRRPGNCAAINAVEVAPGVYDCNSCYIGGRRRRSG